MTPEARARRRIDAMLEAAGWLVQSRNEMNLTAARGVAIREFPLTGGRGYADYLLFVDEEAVGVVEAKKEGTTLGGVDVQSEKYTDGLPDYVSTARLPLPFVYESTGVETFFRDTREPEYRSRRVFAFHRPETLLEWLGKPDTVRERLTRLPPLNTIGLRDCQEEAISGLEKSLADNRPRSLIQMATGSGKTYTAVSFIYRLIKFAGARRVLFLVDRANLGRQTLKEFQQYVTPDDGRKFTELFNVQHQTGASFDTVSKVTISTIQRTYSTLRGEELPNELDEASMGSVEQTVLGGKSAEVGYNPQLPIETYDFVVIDECHRSIYNLWRQVLEYFDAFLVGLTATPSKQTFGFFNQNLVMEYPFERAVADGVNVGYDVYRIKTKIGEKGSTVDAGFEVDYRDKATRAVRWQQLDEALEYQGSELDRSVVSPSQIRTVIRTYRDKLKTELFPERQHVPKTLIFAKNDAHAEDIVSIVREEFGKGNDFCRKITYRAEGDADELIKAFRTSYNPRVAVTVDMISTGTDIKPLEVLLFMRDVKSQTYFEQMVGRGTRTLQPTDLLAVTPDAAHKTHFVLIDAVGVTESAKLTDVRPLERQRGVSFDKLLERVAFGKRDTDTLTSLAGRLARLEQKLTTEDTDRVLQAGGASLQALTNSLLDAVDADRQVAKVEELFGEGTPTEEQLAEAKKALAVEATKPFNNPGLRNLLTELQTRSEQIIDTVSQDEVTYAGYDFDKAEALVTNFRAFIEAHKDELLALQILYNQPYGQRRLTFEAVKELAEALQKPPYYIDSERLWGAYERLEKDRVRGAPAEKLLTNIISLVRFALGQSETLEPYSEQLNRRFSAWMVQQEQAQRFTLEQVEWLVMIKEHLSTSLTIETDDFSYLPFNQKGGRVKAAKLFGPELPRVLEELNRELSA